MIAHPFQLFPILNGIQHYYLYSAANVEIILLYKHFMKIFFKDVIFYVLSQVALIAALIKECIAN